MALQGDYITADTVDHTECYAKIVAFAIDREKNKIQYDITLYHNKTAREMNAPMSTIFISGSLEDYTAISEEDIVKRAYQHLKAMSGMVPDFSAWSDA